MRLDPWASTRLKDYARLRDQFGLEPFAEDTPGVPDHRLFRRGVVFAHRGWEPFGRALEARARGVDEPAAVMTGLMPSGRMHLGHKMVLDQVIAYQRLGCDVTIAVADLEAAATRDVSLAAAQELAREEYLRNYIALGLAPCRFYFQSQSLAVQRLGHRLARRVNWSKLEALYGFGGDTSMAHANAPLVQAADILHPQHAEHGGPRPTLVPVGIDQDPHLRLTRDLADGVRLLHARLTKDGRVGVFVKRDHGVETLLAEAGKLAAGLGFMRQKPIPAYKALYLDDAGAADVARLDAALAQLDAAHGGFGFVAPAGSYHRLMTGLTGDKMSSSQPDSAIFLGDTPDEAHRKVMRAQTTGGQTVAEHREHGGRPDECPVFELLAFHLLDDDDELRRIHDGCRAGEWLCGTCKKLAAERLGGFLAAHRERAAAADLAPFGV